MRNMILQKRTYALPDCIRIPLKAAPVHTAVILLYQALAVAAPIFKIWITALFVDTAIGVAAGNIPFASIAFSLTGLLGVVAFEILAAPLINFIRVRLKIRLRGVLRPAFLEKRARLSYEHIENQECWDLIERVTEKPEDKFQDQFQQMLDLLTQSAVILGTLAVVMVQVWWAGLLIIAVSVPLMYLSVKSGQDKYDAQRMVTKIQRKYKYFSEVLRGRDTVLERSLFQYGGKLDEKYAGEYETARKIQFKVDAKNFIRMKASGMAVSLISVAVALVLTQPVAVGTITVGMFISIVNAILSLSITLSWQLAYNMENLAKNKEYMKDLTRFMALSEQDTALDLPSQNLPPFERLEFRHVTFRYPGMDHDILKDLSFVIENGKHYSFVGVNGAGKTTLTKLITGLFREYDGEIFLNGRELHDYTVADLKAYFCGVFQDFARYSVTMEQNIALGDTAGILTQKNPAEKSPILQRAVALAGLGPAVERLPLGLDTPLGKLEENGVDLSGGEWQRIALARAIVNPAGATILDEPTAALDPIAESEIYEKFREISNGRTTLFISHRLGSTLLADVIYVLSDGVVAERGTHVDLMEQNGLYAEMFESQRSWYR